MRVMKPTKAHNGPAKPPAAISVQTRIVPIIVIISWPFQFVAGSWPVLICCAPECLFLSVYPARQYRAL